MRDRAMLWKPTHAGQRVSLGIRGARYATPPIDPARFALHRYGDNTRPRSCGSLPNGNSQGAVRGG